MLSDRCLSVLSCVMLVYCGQTVGQIKMKLGTQVGLGPGHIVLDGDPAPPRKGAQQPHVPNLQAQALPTSAVHVYCGQTAGWIKVPLGREVGLGPGHIVLDWDPPWGISPNFRPMSIVAKWSPISATAEHLLTKLQAK